MIAIVAIIGNSPRNHRNLIFQAMKLILMIEFSKSLIFQCFSWVNSSRMARLCLVSWAISSSVSHATIINGYTATASNRFSSGFTTTPVTNTDSSYIGLSYDLSGVGWQDGTGVSIRTKNITAITPLNFAIAFHYSSGVAGQKFDYVNALGQLITSTVASVTGGLTTGSVTNDFSIGTMNTAFTADQQVRVYRCLDVANWGYSNMELLIYGSEIDSKGPRLGNALVSYASGASMAWATHSPLATNDAQYWVSGDSSSPGFIKYTAPDGSRELTLAGTAWYPMSMNPYLPSGTYNPTTVLNDSLKGYGYALKWAIYDNPTDTSRTAPQWTGAGGSGTFEAGTNWSTGLMPSVPSVLFDASSAAGQTSITISSGASVRGILFKKSASTQGFIFSGNGTLHVGYSGIRNESTATQTFSLPIALSDSQNWEAANGDLNFKGAIDTATSCLVVVGGTKDTTISAIISGTGSLAKDDAGTLTLNAINSNTGKTIIHNGTVRLGSSGNLSTTDLTFIAGNASVFDLNGRNQSLTDVRSEYGGSGRILLGGGALTVNSAYSGSNQYLGSLEGVGSIVKGDTGTWVLSGVNNYSGSTKIYGGTLRIAKDTALSTNANIELFMGGVLELGSGNFTWGLGTGPAQVQFVGNGGFSAYGATRTVNLGGAGATFAWGSANFVPVGNALVLSSANSNATVEWINGLDLAGGAQMIQVNNGATSVDARIRGAIANGSLIKSGSGTLELSGNNTYTGQTQINGGALLISSGQSLGNGNLSLNVGTVILNSGDFTRSLGTGVGQVTFANAGGFAAYGANRVVNIGGAGATLVWGSTSNFLINGATLLLSAVAANATVDFKNSIDLNGGSRYIYVQDGEAPIDAIMSGNIINGSLVKQGSGVLQFSGSNSYAGETQIQGGSLLVTSANSLGAGNVNMNWGNLLLGVGDFTRALGTGSGQVQFTGGGGFGAFGATRIVNIGGAGAALTWGSGNFLPSGATMILSSVACDAMVDFKNPINFNGATRTIQVDEGTAAVDAKLSGILSNGGLTKTGSGTLELSGANTYTGQTLINGGTLRVSNATAMAASNIIINGGVIELAAGNYTGSLGAGAGQIQFYASGGFSASGGDRIVNIGGSGATLTWGVTSGFLSWGPNTLKLSSSGADSTLIIQNTLDINWQKVEFVVSDGSAAVDARITGALYNGGTLTKSGKGTLELAGANNNWGTTTIIDGTVLVTGTLGGGDPWVMRDTGILTYSNSSALSRAMALSGGTFNYNSSSAYTGTLTFSSGTIGGSGSLANTALNLATGRQISPGEKSGATGTLKTAGEVWDNGGAYIWEINNLSGTAGAVSGWDDLNMTGQLSITAGTAGFAVKVSATGTLSGWDSTQTYSWLIASASSGIVGFDPSKFSFDTSKFSDKNTLKGSFSVSTAANNLYLNYTPTANFPTTISGWRQQYFGSTANTGSAADMADPDHDGLVNMLEYAMGRSPLVAEGGQPIGTQVQNISGQDYLTITFVRSTAATDVDFAVEVTSQLAVSWSTIDPLATANQVSVQNNTPSTGLQTITVKDSQPVSTSDRRFIRLRVTLH